jgi:hypothetical protein
VEFLKGIAMNKPLAKSLHTVTVLVRVARLHLLRIGDGDAQTRNMLAVSYALDTLGLNTLNDDYGLVDAAIKQLNK